MRILPLVAAAITAIVAVVVTAWLGWPVGLVVGVLVGLVAGWLVVLRWDVAVGELADSVRQWRTEPVRRPLRGVDDPLFGDLVAAIEATAHDFDRRVARMDEAMPWRREMIEALPTPAVLFGSDGYVAAANGPARELLAIASDGEPVTMLSALGSAHLATGVRGALGRGPVELDAEVSGRNVRAVATDVGQQQLVLVTDRTRERRVENLRRNFVVNASHELKTPVTSIQALAEALRVMVEGDPERLPALLERLEEESTRLAQLVHDLLDLRRLEEQVRVPPEAVDLVPVVCRALDDVADVAAERDVICTTDLPDRAVVAADPDDARLIVRNLAANAVQYNRDGGLVEVGLVCDDDTVVLEVRDQGIGIPKADLDRIFERFYRVDVARSRQTGGTGLGLSLVRNAVNRTGGTITVDSLLGSGTTFTVRLPAADLSPGPGVAGDRHRATPQSSDPTRPGPGDPDHPGSDEPEAIHHDTGE